jgi:hypothetical protein
VLQFCSERNYGYTFSIYERLPIKISCQGYDFRSEEFPKMNKILLTMYRKMAGIIFMNKKPSDYTLKINMKMNHESGFGLQKVDGIYPDNLDIPEFFEILNHKQYPENDSIRHQLLKWIIDAEKLDAIDLNEISKELSAELLILTHMVKTKVITIKEADIFLFSLLHKKSMIERGEIICYDGYPIHVHPRAFHLVFFFADIYVAVRRSLEILGLENLYRVRTDFFDFLI